MGIDRKQDVKSTKKEHECMGCLKIIPIGSCAYNYVGLWEGKFYCYYLCQSCAGYAEKNDDYLDYDGTFWEGAIAETKHMKEN